ncbi:MAG: amino acid adenylation domain-containing protein [Pseudomonadota bacterium]
MTGAADDRPSVSLSPAQSVLWTGQHLAPDAPLYNMGWRFDLHCAIDPHRFEAAFEAVVARHDALRLVFAANASGATQRAVDQGFDLEVVDLSDHADPDAAADAWIEARISRVFDLSRRALDCALLRLEPENWVWYFNQHHLVTDGAAAALVFSEVSRAYEGADLGPAPSFLARFEAVETADVDAARSHWLATAETAPPSPLYGGDHAETPASTRVTVDVSKGLRDALERSVRDPQLQVFTPQLTEFALLFTAFAAYVHRVTGDERVAIGAPAHNRLTPDDRKTMGLFVETFPVDVDVLPSDSFDQLFVKVKEALAGYLRHARPGASTGAAAKRMTAVFNYITAEFGDFAGHPARVTWVHPKAHDPRHGVRLHAMRFDGRALSLALDVNDALASKTSAHDIPQHFTAMLEALLRDRSLEIGAVPLCGAQDVLTLRQVARGPEEADAALVLDRIAAQPDGAVAVREGVETLTYGALEARVAIYRGHLASFGVKPGDRVLVHAGRGLELVPALLGVLSLGAAFVPVAANTPAARVREIARLAQVTAAVSDGERTAVVQAMDVPIVPLGAEAGPAAPAQWPDREQAAYVIFTSGSTGTPKGVEVTHGGLARYSRWAAKAFGGEHPADYALFSSLSFDLTITSIFAPLTTGGTVVVYPETGTTDLAVLDVFADDAVDVVKLTPSHLSLVCAQNTPVSRIRSLVLGGENLTTALCRKAQSVLSPEIAIYNEYGPTEAVVGCMIHRFEADSDQGTSVPIGRPADGVEITVRDAGLNVVPYGVVGEICIGGRLARGYLARADLTAECFVDDPMSPGRTIYRSGDLGRLRPDGVFEYLGRADTQLKVGGVRIETSEIAAALQSVAGVDAVHIQTHVQRSPQSACKTCGLPDTYPGAVFNSDGVCQVCEGYEGYRSRAQSYFQSPEVLAEKIEDIASKATGAYDLIMLLSGGKDSTYAAYRLAEYGKRVLALTLDNGYISDGAKDNIRRVAEDLGWDHRFLQTDAMNQIFVESLKAHSNVCQGCFKTIYSLALRVARDEGVAGIVTGLSRGQFFETRLTPELFVDGAPSAAEIDHLVDAARRQYHAQDDAVSRLLCADDLRDGSVLDHVSFIDIYRYIDVPVSEIYRFLGERAKWIRPEDTGRSTNCLINDVGIYVHSKREGFHNYALPYSWDVRLGHKTRDEALHELNDEIDEDRVVQILEEIGFDEEVAPARPHRIVAYVAARGGVSTPALWDVLRTRLVPEALPTDIVVIEDMPLTANGKVDSARLPSPSRDRSAARADYRAPSAGREAVLEAIFCEVLGLPRVGVDDNFYDIGGDSLAAIQIAIQANEAGLGVPATAVFEHPTIARLAIAAEASGTSARVDDTPLVDLDDDDLAGITRALS